MLKEKSKKLLTIGAKGNESILRGINYGFNEIFIIDNNKAILKFLQKECENYPVEMKFIHIDPRLFFKINTNKFDLIEIALNNSFITHSIPSLCENYIYIVESFNV